MTDTGCPGTNRRVVVLNGPSSSGKTSLTNALQDRLDGVWFTFGIDTLTAAVPERFTVPGYPFQAEEFESLGRGFSHLEHALPDFIAALAARGVDLVVDTVFQEGSISAERWRTALEGAAAIIVGLHAPDQVLEERAAARGDRARGLATAQATVVHVDVDYDLEFDTSVVSLDKMVASIADALGADVRPGHAAGHISPTGRD